MLLTKEIQIKILIKEVKILKEKKILLQEKLKKIEDKEIIARKNNFKLTKIIKNLQEKLEKKIKKEKNKMILVTVFDKKAEKHGNVYTELNTAVAIRGFAEACQNPKSPMGMFPEDIELCLVGEYDEITGIIIPKQPTTIAKAIEYIKKEANN